MQQYVCVQCTPPQNKGLVLRTIHILQSRVQNVIDMTIFKLVLPIKRRTVSYLLNLHQAQKEAPSVGQIQRNDVHLLTSDNSQAGKCTAQVHSFAIAVLKTQ